MTELYPHARVVLSVRDPKEWYNSARATILNQDLRRHLEQAVLPDARQMAETLLSLTDAMTARGFPVDHGEQEAIASFERHNEAVRAAVDPDRLLVYEVRQGWEPLCAFLGVDVPDKPFPRGTEAGVFAGKMRRLAGGEADSTS
ncbi:sulfotransferase family protein [Streptomyces sp. NPDC008159]|uniref:sulfotransferase family protein n=1 Tax=Streptomyces sp. NPDC008159 TaxID=3364817 RepID=UPI0036EF910E